MADGVAWTCPRCGQAYASAPDASGMVTCPMGHQAYSGYVAEVAALQTRLTWLDERVQAGDPPPDETWAHQYGIWPPTAPPHATGGAPPPAEPYAVAGERQPAGAQVLLLGLGAALLIVAAIIFAAVVWDRLGAAGKVGVMALATLGCGWLALRLRHRLPGTAEALAVVTYGLAVVDVVAAPALGLVPEEWTYPDRLYLAVVAAGVGGLSALLGRRFGLRAWCWLGWVTVALSAGLLTWWLMVGPLSDQPWRAVALSVLSLSAVALLAVRYDVPGLAVDRGPVTLGAVTAAGLAVLTLPAALLDLDRLAFLGTAITLLVTAAALVWLLPPARFVVTGYVAAVLGGAAAGLLLLLLPDTEAVWPAIVTGGAGVLGLAGLARLRLTRIGLVVSAVAWATWGLGRLAVVGPASLDDPVYVQIALVLAVAAATWWVVAWRSEDYVLAWPAALVAGLAWLCLVPHLSWLPELPEASWLPVGLFLVVGGLVWRHQAGGKSMSWLAPGVAVALLPSAFVCWAAPWVYPFSEQSTAEALTRLLAVLVVGVITVAVGARLRLAGLLVPGTIALVVVSAAQVWSGAQAMPRWIAFGIAGALLIGSGARIEWVRSRGRWARRYVDGLA